MKKVFKIIFIIIALIFISLAGLYLYTNESLPGGKQGKEADELAQKMLNALNYEAYKNTTHLEWSFRGEHFYKWDKKAHKVEMSWEDKKVVLFPDTPEKNEVTEGGSEAKNSTIIAQAIRFFNNDSFWLVAPYKVFDGGVERRLVSYEGKDALLITYTTGGSTPGDSYLWILDDKGMPTRFKMWVSILPIGGMEGSWNDWVKVSTGAMLPASHDLAIGKLDLGEVKGY